MQVKSPVKNNFKKEVILRRLLKDGIILNLNKLVAGKEMWKNKLEFQEEGPPKTNAKKKSETF